MLITFQKSQTSLVTTIVQIMGWVMQGWGGSYRGGVDHTGVGWVIQGWGWSQRGGVGHAGVKWVMQGWGGSCRGGGQVGHTEAGWGGS